MYETGWALANRPAVGGGAGVGAVTVAAVPAPIDLQAVASCRLRPDQWSPLAALSSQWLPVPALMPGQFLFTSPSSASLAAVVHEP